MTELLTADMARTKNDEINRLNKEKIEEICGNLIDKINHMIAASIEENKHSLVYMAGYSSNTNLIIRALNLLKQKLNDLCIL